MPQNLVFETAAVFASGVWAGTMESSKGRASVTPIPRKNVRRGKCFLVMNIVSRLSICFSSAGLGGSRLFRSHLKRRALHDSQHQRREAVTVARGIPCGVLHD